MMLSIRPLQVHINYYNAVIKAISYILIILYSKISKNKKSALSGISHALKVLKKMKKVGVLAKLHTPKYVDGKKKKSNCSNLKIDLWSFELEF